MLSTEWLEQNPSIPVCSGLLDWFSGNFLLIFQLDKKSFKASVLGKISQIFLRSDEFEEFCFVLKFVETHIKSVPLVLPLGWSHRNLGISR